MDLTKDIQSLTTFKRNTTELVRRIMESGRPVVLTINGRAEPVVPDAGSWQQLIERVDSRVAAPLPQPSRRPRPSAPWSRQRSRR